MKEITVTELEKLFKDVYSREFGLRYFLEGKPFRVEVTRLYADQKSDVEGFKEGFVVPPWEQINVLEALMCDLASKKKLGKGKYEIVFGD